MTSKKLTFGIIALLLLAGLTVFTGLEIFAPFPHLHLLPLKVHGKVF